MLLQVVTLVLLWTVCAANEDSTQTRGTVTTDNSHSMVENKDVTKIKFDSEDTASDYYGPQPGWISPQLQQSYSLELSQPLELKTTMNQVEAPITVYFIFPEDKTQFINFKCTDLNSSRWILVIKQCMTDSWYAALPLNGVSSDQIKVWRITRTETSLLVECNGVTVLNFNFASDYKDGFSSCHSFWTRHSTAIKFNWSGGLYKNNGHLSMRTAVNKECSELPSTWINMASTPDFPVLKGEVITVSCTPGYTLTGDNQVTCESEQNFQYSVQPSCKEPDVRYHIRGPGRHGEAVIGTGSSITCSVAAPEEDETFGMEVNGRHFSDIHDSVWTEAGFSRSVYRYENGTIETRIEGLVESFTEEHDMADIKCYSNKYEGEVSMTIKIQEPDVRYHIRGPGRHGEAVIGSGSSITCSVAAPEEDYTFMLEINGNNWNSDSFEGAWTEAGFARSVYQHRNGTISTAIEGFVESFTEEHDMADIRCYSKKYEGEVSMTIKLQERKEVNLHFGGVEMTLNLPEFDWTWPFGI